MEHPVRVPACSAVRRTWLHTVPSPERFRSLSSSPPAPAPPALFCQVYRFFMTGDDAKCEEVDGRQVRPGLPRQTEARTGLAGGDALQWPERRPFAWQLWWDQRPAPRHNQRQGAPSVNLPGWQAAEFEARAAGIRSDIERLGAVRSASCLCLGWLDGCTLCSGCCACRGCCAVLRCIQLGFPVPCTSRPCNLCTPAPLPALCPPRPQSNEALRAEIERLRGEPSPLLAARGAKEETLADKEKFLKLLDNLQASLLAGGCCGAGCTLCWPGS